MASLVNFHIKQYSFKEYWKKEEETTSMRQIQRKWDK